LIIATKSKETRNNILTWDIFTSLIPTFGPLQYPCLLTFCSSDQSYSVFKFLIFKYSSVIIILLVFLILHCLNYVLYTNIILFSCFLILHKILYVHFSLTKILMIYRCFWKSISWITYKWKWSKCCGGSNKDNHRWKFVQLDVCNYRIIYNDHIPYSKKLWRGKNFGEFGKSQQFANFFAKFPVFVTWGAHSNVKCTLICFA